MKKLPKDSPEQQQQQQQQQQLHMQAIVEAAKKSSFHSSPGFSRISRSKSGNTIVASRLPEARTQTTGLSPIHSLSFRIHTAKKKTLFPWIKKMASKKGSEWASCAAECACAVELSDKPPSLVRAAAAAAAAACRNSCFRCRTGAKYEGFHLEKMVGFSKQLTEKKKSNPPPPLLLHLLLWVSVQNVAAAAAAFAEKSAKFFPYLSFSVCGFLLASALVGCRSSFSKDICCGRKRRNKKWIFFKSWLYKLTVLCRVRSLCMCNSFNNIHRQRSLFFHIH